MMRTVVTGVGQQDVSDTGKQGRISFCSATITCKAKPRGFLGSRLCLPTAILLITLDER